MASHTGALLDGGHPTCPPQQQRRSPALKTEYDDLELENGRRNRSQSAQLSQQQSFLQPQPSPLHSQSSGFDSSAYADANETPFTASSFALRAEDEDVPMTDATDSTATATATTVAAAERTAQTTSRSSPPTASTATVTGAQVAGKKPRGSGSRSRGGGALTRGRGGGGGSASRGGRVTSRGGGSSSGKMPKARSRATGGKTLPNGKTNKTGGGGGGGGGGASVGSSPLSSDNEDEEDENENENENGDHERGGDSDNGPYCICRGPDDHRWMIQCDQCEDWFHGDCVDINKELGESVILSYICPNCAIPDRYVTRFRKLCSLSTCRQPARLLADDNISAAPPDSASYFCSDEHRDQWWDALLARIYQQRKSGGDAAVPEDKMPVDQFTPTQLVAVLASTNQEGVAQMLLHGLTQDSNVDSDSLLTSEERAVTQKSAAHRYHLAEQFVMCKKMLELLDMAKSRNYDAIKAGLIERDCCGYDDRLEHVGVQPHFERFLASPAGAAIFRAGRLSAPEGQDEKDQSKDGAMATDDTAAAAADETPADYEAATAGMCRKRKCKAHLGWFPTLARDVRMQMQDLTREAAAQRDNETRIQLAAVQRAFVKRHMSSEVVFVAEDEEVVDHGHDGPTPSATPSSYPGYREPSYADKASVDTFSE